MSRIIKIKLLTQVSLVSIESNARTFGEFKREEAVKALNINWNQVKVIDRASKVSFDMDESVLPAIDAIFFITPTKTDSGMGDTRSNLYAEIEELKQHGVAVSFNYTRKSNAFLKEFCEACWEQLEADNAPEELTLEEKLHDFMGSINSQIENFILENTCQCTEVEFKEVELLDTTTTNDLDKEAKSLPKFK